MDLAPPGYKGDSYKADIVSCLCAGMFVCIVWGFDGKVIWRIGESVTFAEIFFSGRANLSY